ncbi:MAG: cobalamin B12-binding domain-containing protein [Rhizobiales bacterium]|nr:cobalamin B12-binding domain-containing protein [Hyphomicrobiales bacterium]
MFEVGTAALRGVISAPLDRVRRKAAAKPVYDESVNAIIEGDIIPRLMMAHSSGSVRSAARHSRPIDPEAAKRFSVLPLQLEAAGLLEEVESFMAEGASVETIFLDLLAPAARKLGEMWESDECDFIDVTMGLWRLQEVMREVAARVPAERDFLCAPRSGACFCPMPGDNHNFGALMIEEVFARAGWQSEALIKPERRELLDRLARRPYDLVGLTLTRDCPSAALANLVKAMRKVSANPDLIIFVGGRMINNNPHLVAEVDADGTACDALSALELAENLVTMPVARGMNLR